MKIQSLRTTRLPDPAAAGKRSRSVLLLILALIAGCGMAICSCKGEGEPIDKPDEFTHVYQAHEKYILRAISQVLKDKDFGTASVNGETNEVTTDYIVQGEWRIRGLARIRKVNPREREVTFSIVSEKKTREGWEMRRLLGKEQYEQLFDAIETQIYREIAKPE